MNKDEYIAFLEKQGLDVKEIENTINLLIKKGVYK